MELSSTASLAAIEAADWDALVAADDNPFVEHAFLLALERSGSVGTADSGWWPCHLLVHDGPRLVGAMPLYGKDHPFGEYVFDDAWATAAQRAGIPYYPKLVAAVPFTPVTGPRLLLHPQAPPAVAELLWQGAQAMATRLGATSVHVLFCPQQQLPPLVAAGGLLRHGLQFHWQRQPGWHDEAAYLASLHARARKQIRRERAVAQGHGLRLAMLPGAALRPDDWSALEAFYRSTVADKGGMAYLTPAFFAALRGPLLPRVLAAMAWDGAAPVAGALFFWRGRQLFGRYWGARRSFDALHFELCYHMPIAWALAHGIERFEAGAQGLHKLKRGLLPQRCHSVHWLRHPALHQGVARFVTAEQQVVASQLEALMAQGPYRRGPAAGRAPAAPVTRQRATRSVRDVLDEDRDR